MSKKIILGTAQFGMEYGVVNKSGQIEISQASEIISFLTENHVSTLDTAVVYGNSESILGKLDIDTWDVITKLPAVPVFSSRHEMLKWILEQAYQSLERVNKKKFNAILLHKATDLLTDSSNDLYWAISELKEKGICQKIGVSAYDFDEVENICKKYSLDIVQAPVNILNSDFISDQACSLFMEENIELHARSIFLQGLLLCRNLPLKFADWQPLWDRWFNWLDNNQLDALDVCVNYINSHTLISKFVVGVDSLQHAKQIVSVVGKQAIEIPLFDNFDPLILDPRRWSNL